jgi:hypothetical protein
MLYAEPLAQVTLLLLQHLDHVVAIHPEPSH